MGMGARVGIKDTRATGRIAIGVRVCFWGRFLSSGMLEAGNEIALFQGRPERELPKSKIRPVFLTGSREESDLALFGGISL